MLTLVPMMPEHDAVVRALVSDRLAGTRYLERSLEQLHTVLQFEDPEYLAVLAARDEAIVGVAIFGTVAGARACTRLHLLLGDDDALDALVHGIVELCADASERLVVCELAGDALFATAWSALGAAGFVEEGVIDHYVAEDVALRLMVWRND